MKNFAYVQMCTNLRTGEVTLRGSTISSEAIVSYGYAPDVNGLLQLLNDWNKWPHLPSHPNLRWFYYTDEA